MSEGPRVINVGRPRRCHSAGDRYPRPAERPDEFTDSA